MTFMKYRHLPSTSVKSITGCHINFHSQPFFSYMGTSICIPIDSVVYGFCVWCLGSSFVSVRSAHMGTYTSSLSFSCAMAVLSRGHRYHSICILQLMTVQLLNHGLLCVMFIFEASGARLLSMFVLDKYAFLWAVYPEFTFRGNCYLFLKIALPYMIPMAVLTLSIMAYCC